MAHPLTVSTTLAGLAALLLLAGCAAPPAPGASATSPGEAPTPTQSPGATGGASPTTENFDGTNKYFPVGIGNTWVYRLTDGNGGSTLTDVMSEVVRDGTDVVATFDRTLDHDGDLPDETSSVEWVFHDDGSVSEPLAYLVGDGEGILEWPSTAEFEAGSPKTGTIPVGLGTVDFSILGQGEESITIPFGTYSTRRLVQNLLLSGPDFTNVPWAPTYWLSADVGIVRSEIPDYVFGGAPAITELVNFTPGT